MYSDKTPNFNRIKISFWIIAIVSFGVRVWMSFSRGLLIGNGGYYPLQVRTVLERNELAFSDMPLLFYLDAGIIHVLSLFGFDVSNDLILNVVKLVDSLSIPLLLIPLYHILKSVKKGKISNLVVVAASFSVMSFHTLNLVSTCQKNSLAITFLFCSVAFFLNYLELRKKTPLVLCLLFLVFVGFTHFGTFTFALLVISLYLIFKYRWKGIAPLIGVLIVSVGFVYVFDPTRADRMLSIWNEVFRVLPRPPQLILMLIYVTAGLIALKAYKKLKSNFRLSHKLVIQTLIALLILVPLPIVNPQYTERLSAFLFIPIVILVFYFDEYLSKRTRNVVSIILALVVTGSLTMTFIKRERTDLSKEALSDFKNMKSLIDQPDETVIVSKHNLEFWVAWELKVSVSQEAKFDEELINEYEDVFIINQNATKNRHPNDHGRGPSHFDEPKIPNNSRLVYSSNYFKLYRYTKE